MICCGHSDDFLRIFRYFVVDSLMIFCKHSDDLFTGHSDDLLQTF